MASCKNLRNFCTKKSEVEVEIIVTPEKGLVDDDFKVYVQGLKPYQRVTLFCQLQEQGWKFGSIGEYVADRKGEIDTGCSESVGGSFKGLEPEGLLWAMTPLPGQKDAICRLLKKDVTKPYVIRLQLLDGHNGWEKAFVNNSYPLKQVSFERSYLAPNVKRTEVRNGRVRGSMFVPDGRGPFPAVIDLFGVAGRLIDHRAALLASKGFVTLALPYFGYKDLQKTLDCVEIEYFEEAVHFMLGLEFVNARCGIGVIGVSKGAEIAMTMAEFLPEVTSVIAINGVSYVHECPTTYRGLKRVPPWCDIDRLEWIPPNGLLRCANLFDEKWINDERYSIRIDKSNAQFLFIGCELDDCIHPKFAQINADKLKRAAKNNYDVVVYPGAGHLLEPPHSPLGTEAYNTAADVMMSYGGEQKMHARAQESSWRLIQNFFHLHLRKRGTISMPKQETTLMKSML